MAARGVTIAVALATRPLEGGVTGAADAAAILAGSLGTSCAALIAGLATCDLLAGFARLAGLAILSGAATVLPRTVARLPFAVATGTMAADDFGAVLPAAWRTGLTAALGLTATVARCFEVEACFPVGPLPGTALATVLPALCARGADLTAADFLAAGLLGFGALPTTLPVTAALPAPRADAAGRCTGLLRPGLGAVVGLDAAVFLLATTFFAAVLATGFFTGGRVTRPIADFAGALAGLRAGLDAACALLAVGLAGFALVCAALCVLATPLP